MHMFTSEFVPTLGPECGHPVERCSAVEGHHPAEGTSGTHRGGRRLYGGEQRPETEPR